MRAITLYQPWAQLIIVGAKLIETRSWAPPQWAIGTRIAIHAGKRIVEFPDQPEYREFNEAVARLLGTNWVKEVPRGAVVGTALLKGRRQVRTLRDLPTGNELLFGEYGEGRWLWELDEIEAFDTPIPARGYQGLWTWDRNGTEEGTQPRQRTASRKHRARGASRPLL